MTNLLYNEDLKQYVVGFYDLNDTLIPIDPMHDGFLNYCFRRKNAVKYAELLLRILVAEAERELGDKNALPLPNGIGKIKTQKPHHKITQNKPPRVGSLMQDLWLESLDAAIQYYLEFQKSGDKDSNHTIFERSSTYLRFSLIDNDAQIYHTWLLRDVPTSLKSKNRIEQFTFQNVRDNGLKANFKFSVSYFYLKNMAKDKSVAGEFAKFLLGKSKSLKNPEVMVYRKF